MQETDIKALQERLFLFLEESNWTKASEYAERMLDIEPRNAQAYLGKLMIDYKVSTKEMLGELKREFNENINYKRIVQFGDALLVNEIQGYLEKISNTKAANKTKTMNSPVRVAIRNNKFVMLIVVIVILLIGSIVGIVLSLHPSDSNIPTETVKYDKNYIQYKGMTVKIPSDAKYTASVLNDKICLKGNNIPSINEFLGYISPPEGKEFFATDGFASSNGNKSFIIKSCRNANVQFYADKSFEGATLDLIFCGYSTYNAKYLSSDGRMPQNISGSSNGMLGMTDNNAWKSKMQFFQKETTLIGQYRDKSTKQNATTITITVIIENMN